MSDDRHTRPTRPPAAPPPLPQATEEDSPPLQRGPVSPRVLPETIAKIALRAPLKPALSEREELLRAVAQVSRDQVSREDKLRAELRDLIIEHLPIPADPKLPSVSVPPEKKKFSIAPKSIRDMSWMAHVPAILMAIAALVATVAQSCVKKQELSSDALAKIQEIRGVVDAHVQSHDLKDVQAAEKKQLERQYLVDQRNWLAPVLEKLSVKVDDPPGAPPRPDMGFYPPPVLSSKAPRIQPHATFPAPPPL